MKFHTLALLGVLFAGACHANFIIPDAPEGAQTEFAWWDVFSDPYTDWQLPALGETVPAIPNGEGNTPNREEGDNMDAMLLQTADSAALISGSNGIYGNSGLNTEFIIYDTPAYEADSVLLQLRSLGSHANVETAELFYRESANGPLKSAGASTGGGFLFSGSDTFTAWEWDLSSFTIFDYYIYFESAGSSMSLQEVQLDTFDAVTNFLGYPLEIETNADFGPIGEVEHHLVGETESQLSYQVGDMIELTPVANPAYGHEFVGWRNALTGSESPATVSMVQGMVVEAIFAPTTYTFWSYNNINPYLADYSQRTPASADPNHNGITNLLEYALGGDPEAFETNPNPTGSMSADGQYLCMTFKRQLAATDLTYRVMVSHDMENWNYNGDGTGQAYTQEHLETTFNDNGTETVTFQDLTPIPANGQRYMTLAVILN